MPCSSKISGLSGLQRRARVAHDRQRLVLDIDQLQRVLGEIAALRRDRRDRLADEAHLLRREAVHAPLLRHRRRRLAPAHRVLACHDRDDARRALGRARVERCDLRVRERAAQDRAVQHARERQVIDELRPSCHELPVLDARHGLADVARRARRQPFDGRWNAIAGAGHRYSVSSRAIASVSERSSTASSAPASSSSPTDSDPVATPSAIRAVRVRRRDIKRRVADHPDLCRRGRGASPTRSIALPTTFARSSASSPNPPSDR